MCVIEPEPNNTSEASRGVSKLKARKRLALTVRTKVAAEQRKEEGPFPSGPSYRVPHLNKKPHAHVLLRSSVQL